ncbi:MAG: PhoH family protein [Armatimonadetes bacterium]|nr:PhoH family protein [Armatimonadota bacterium]
MAKHAYVIDTCVLIHDPSALYKFQDNDMYLPLAVVDDLDELKQRRDPTGWAAREVFRHLDKLNLEDLVSKGVVMNSKGGKLFIYNMEAPATKGEVPVITRVNSDNAIIQTCLILKAKSPRKKVAIVTKDTGLRVRAQSMGCAAENYRSDLLEDEAYEGIRSVVIESGDDWSILYGDHDNIDITELSQAIQTELTDLSPNEFVVFQHGTACCPCWFKKGKLHVLRDKHGHKPDYMGVKPHNLEQRFAMMALSDDDVPLVVLSGQAGTGKTILSLAVALQKVQDGTYDRVVVIKPNVPVGGIDIGALPGDKYEKLSAWLGPIKDNVQQLTADRRRASQSYQQMLDDGLIEVEALSYIQGRSITNSVIIVDELQNVSPRVARMVVERCGRNSKIVLLGDPSQVENPFLDIKSNGLAHATLGAKDSELAAVVQLSKVERSQLAAAASKIFARPEAR